MTITAENLCHVYNSRTPHSRTALSGVSMQISDGACAAIVGVTGSGKSTLVQHFNGLLWPTSGTLLVNGIRIGGSRPSRSQLTALRRQVGLLFQFPESQLFAPTIFDDIAFGPRQLNLKDTQIHERVTHALRSVALDDSSVFWKRSPFELSGGQKRRVAIAGVLAMRPTVLILDEPSAGLDAEARNELYGQLARLQHDEGLTIIIVSHDMTEVAALADTVFVLHEGQVKLSGHPESVFRRSEELRTYGLIPPPLMQLAGAVTAKGGLLAEGLVSVETVSRAMITLWRAPAEGGQTGLAAVREQQSHVE